MVIHFALDIILHKAISLHKVTKPFLYVWSMISTDTCNIHLKYFMIAHMSQLGVVVFFC